MSKQVIVIRKDLKLRRGKECAQVAHASMMWLSKRFRDVCPIIALIFAAGIAIGIFIMHVSNVLFPSFVPLYLFFATWIFSFLLIMPSVSYRLFFNKPERDWLLGSFAKVCLQIESEEELKEIYKKAKEKGLVTEQVIDSGKTEFHGVPTRTAVAIGPAENEKVDEITSHLKLY